MKNLKQKLLTNIVFVDVIEMFMNVFLKATENNDLSFVDYCRMAATTAWTENFRFGRVGLVGFA